MHAVHTRRCLPDTNPISSLFEKKRLSPLFPLYRNSSLLPPTSFIWNICEIVPVFKVPNFLKIVHDSLTMHDPG